MMIVMSVYKEIYFSEQGAGGTFSGSVAFSRRTDALTYKKVKKNNYFMKVFSPI
jgi:hypothetical protein